jgi:Asp-tRNA(Asn)/Glu-tRNA(Gln) amidotransferase A subunit family amidase
MVKNAPKKALRISELSEDNIDIIQRETIRRVNKTVTALEAALATWDASEEKPEDMEERFANYRRFHDALEDWERKTLKAQNKKEKFEVKVRRLREFVDICFANS